MIVFFWLLIAGSILTSLLFLAFFFLHFFREKSGTVRSGTPTFFIHCIFLGFTTSSFHHFQRWGIHAWYMPGLEVDFTRFWSIQVSPPFTCLIHKPMKSQAYEITSLTDNPGRNTVRHRYKASSHHLQSPSFLFNTMHLNSTDGQYSTDGQCLPQTTINDAEDLIDLGLSTNERYSNRSLIHSLLLRRSPMAVVVLHTLILGKRSSLGGKSFSGEGS